jgi:hypothetical protein
VSRIINWPYFLLFLAVAGLFAYGANRWLGINFWIGFGVAVVALLIVGWLGVVEDDMSGGLHNPKPKNNGDKGR